MNGKKKGLIALSVLFTLSFGGALAGCGGGSHDPQLVAEKDPTCTEAGHEQYYLCTHCDKMYSDEAGKIEIPAPVVKPALGHDMSKHDEDQATCTHPGNVEYYTCSREPGVYYADEAGALTLEEIGVTVDHDFTGNDSDGNPNTRPAVDPTKETPGRKPSWTCRSCGTMFGDKYGDKVVTEEDLTIDPIQETIDGTLTEAFYHEENAFVIGADNVLSGGLGMVLNATLAQDGVYFHLVTNYNTPAAEQDKWGSVKVYINARNTEDKYLPGNAAVSEAETIVMKLDLSGSITTHDAHTVKAHETVTNGDGAPTKYTTTWEVYCSFEQLSETNRAALAYAFEKQEGKTVLKNGYNILVTAVGCMFNKDNADKFENNGMNRCSPIGDGDVQEAWFLWERVGYSDRNEGHKYMILTPEGFSKDFQTVATEYKVNAVKAENASLDGLPEKVAVNGTLQGTVSSVKEGCEFLGLDINGKTVKVETGSFSVNLADLNLPWNTAEIIVTPVAVKNETQTVTLTLKDKSKQGVTALANTQVSLSDGYNEPIIKTTDANGAVTFDDLLCTTYTLSAEGYPQKMLAVSKGMETAESELIKIFAVSDNDDVFVDDLQKTVSIAEALPEDLSYTGSAEIVADSDLKTVMFETTVNAENFEKGWNYKRTMQRFVIQMTDTEKGFFFWTFHREDIGQGYKANIKAINDLTNRENEGKEDLDINDWTEDERGWLAQYVESGGLQLRVVRNGGSIALYAHHDDDGWVYLGSVECGENDKTKIVLFGTGCGWEFSETSLTDLGTYMEEEAPAVGKPGHIAHFVNGSKYYLPDGTPTTAEEVVLELVESTAKVTLELFDLNGDPVTVVEGTDVTVSSRFHNGTLAAGSNGLLSGMLYVGTYTARLYGYKNATLTVEASGNITLIMNATIGYAGNDKVTVNDTDNTITIAEDRPGDNSYAGNAEVVADSNLKTVMFETTVKGINMEDGWTWKSNQQRFIIQMTESGKGFFFWVWTEGGVGKANYQEIFSLTDQTQNKGRDLNGMTEKERGWISPLIARDGLKLRVVRNGDTLALYAYNGTEWKGLGSMKCEENDQTKIVLYGTGCGWEFSDVSVGEPENTEYVLNAAVTGSKAGVKTNLDEGATVRFTSLLGYDKTFTVKDGKIGGENEKLSAGTYTVTVSGNSYAVFKKNITVSAGVNEIAFDYEKFTIMEREGSYDLYDFSHVGDENATIGSKEYIERFNALSTDKYDNVSVTLVGKFNNSEAGNRSQGIFIRFDDGKYMFLRFSWWADQYKIEFMQGGGDTWDLPVADNRTWDDVHMMTAEQTQKWTSGAEMELKLVREGKTLKVYFEGELVGTRELSEGYDSSKVQVGFFAMDAAENASWKFEISETLPEA